MPERVGVAVVGAGQAGLSASWYLTEAGLDHVVLERATAAHAWQSQRWDSFTLVTPNWQCRLPGFPYAGGDPDGFMTRDEVCGYLAAYVDRLDPPLREGVAVTSVRPSSGGGFDVQTGTGAYAADAVVVATGGYHTPKVPRLAERLPASVTQLTATAYRSAEALPEGAVLVVGTGQSGAQIAEDLHLAGRTVHLVTGSAPRVARFYRGRDCVAWLEEMGHYDVPVAQQPGGLAAREKTNHYVTGRGGGRDIDLRAFARDGMRLYGRLVGAEGSRVFFGPTLGAALDGADAVAESIKDAIDNHIAAVGVDAPEEERYRPVWRPESEPGSLDLTAAGVSTVVWATGFSTDYRWLLAPTFDGEGAPCHDRGVSPVPGLYFLGLPWLHTWGSGRFAAVGRDAAYVVGHLARRLRVGRRPLRWAV